MTFALMRWGFPNIAAILALAAAPLLATVADWQPRTAAAVPVEAAAICQPAADCTTVAAAPSPDLIFE